MTIRNKARQLKELMQERRKEVKATLRDLELLLTCFENGEYEPMKATRLYTKYGPEYCEYLEILAEGGLA